MMSDYGRSYEILGLKPGASKAQIKEAYRNLAKRWHPDQFTQNEAQRRQAEEKIKLINEAYQQLKDNSGTMSASSFEYADLKVELKTRTISPWEIYEKATQFVKDGQYREAAEALTTAIRIYPTYADAYRYRGFIYSVLGYELRAAADLQKADELGLYNHRSATQQSQARRSPKTGQSYQPDWEPTSDQDSPSTVAQPHTESAISAELTCEFTFSDCPSPLKGIALSPNLKFMAAGGQDGIIYLWNYKSKKLFHTLKGHLASVRALLFSEDSQLLFSSSQDGTIKVWHLATGSLVKTFAGHTESVESIGISFPRKLLVSCSLDGSVCTWNLKEGVLIRKVLNQPVPVHTLVLNREGEVAFCGLDDGSIRQCHVLRGGILKWLEPHKAPVTSVALAHGGRYFASSSADRQTLLWSYPKSDPIRTLQSPNTQLNSIAFASQDTLLLGGGEDGSLSIWDMATGNLICRQIAHSQRIQSVLVLPETDSLLTASQDATIQHWQIHKSSVSC